MQYAVCLCITFDWLFCLFSQINLSFKSMCNNECTLMLLSVASAGSLFGHKSKLSVLKHHKKLNLKLTQLIYIYCTSLSVCVCCLYISFSVQIFYRVMKSLKYSRTTSLHYSQIIVLFWHLLPSVQPSPHCYHIFHISILAEKHQLFHNNNISHTVFGGCR